MQSNDSSPASGDAALPLSGLRAKGERIIAWGCLGGLCILLGYYLVYVNIRLAHGHFGDFPTFYHAAQAARDGRDLFTPYENDLSYVYPPLLAVCFEPLTHLSKITAARLMLPINLLCVAAALGIGVRELSRRLGSAAAAGRWAGICLLAGMLSENELRNQLQALETDVILLLAFVLALYWLDRRPMWAGAALAFAINIKYLPIVVLPWFLLRRRWKAAAGLVVWTIIWGLLPALAIGWQKNAQSLHVALGGLLKWFGVQPLPGAPNIAVHGIADGLSISVTSGIARFLRSRQQSPALALGITAILGAAGMLLAARWYHKNHLGFWKWPAAAKQTASPYDALVGLEWVSLIVMALAFSPDTNPRHLALALPVNIAATVMLLAPRPGVRRGPLALGTALMLFAFIMPFPAIVPAASRHLYFYYGISSWGMLGGYLTLLWTGVRCAAAPRGPAP